MRNTLRVLLIVALLFAWWTERHRRQAETRYLETVLDPDALGDGWHHIGLWITLKGATYNTNLTFEPYCEDLRADARKNGRDRVIRFIGGGPAALEFDPDSPNQKRH